MRKTQHYANRLFSEALSVLLVRGYVLVAPNYEARFYNRGVALEKDGKGYVLIHDYRDKITNYSSGVVITLYRFDNSSLRSWKEEDILKGSVPFFDFDEFEKIEEFGSYGIVFNWEHGEKAENWIYDDILEANEIGAKRKEREEWHDFLKRGYERTFHVKETPLRALGRTLKLFLKKTCTV